MLKYSIISFLFLIIFTLPVNGQSPAEKILQERGEVYLIFPRPSREKINRLSRKISIDAVKEDSVVACVNKKEYEVFLKEKIPFRIYFYPRPKKTDKTKSLADLESWTAYPTYEQYDSIMQKFATDHPGICKIDTIGSTYQGRLLLAVKISDHVDREEEEPAFFYTSTMHGDETGGYILMLHLIDYLLSNYASDDTVRMLVDSLEIWINPLANPDGTYYGGNNSVDGARRYNAQNIDLNRNFPNPEDGPHPDGNDYAVETIAMMQFLHSRNFILSANFHAGEEVVNYPWDTWTSSERTHADDAWFQCVSREYADTVHAHSPAGYMTYADNGVTNGGDWYVITGSRQDYVTWYLHGREITVELDHSKITPEDELNSLWKYNYHSLLNYMQEAIWGISGDVTDSVTGKPVRARIEIPGHDKDSSWVWSDSLSGYYHRLILEGTYDLQVSAPGYRTKNLSGVVVTNHRLTRLDVTLAPVSVSITPPSKSGIYLFPNPVHTGSSLTLRWGTEEKATISFTGPDGRKRKEITVQLREGENPIPLPLSISGICFVTIRGTHSPAVTEKLVILP